MFLEYYSELFFAESDIRAIKAPPGKMFEIYGVQFTNIANVANSIGVYTAKFEERAVAGFGETPALFVFRTDIAGGNLSVMLPENEPVKSKYISLVTGSTTVIQTYVIVYYKVVIATKVELIWEFIKRGKNP